MDSKGWEISLECTVSASTHITVTDERRHDGSRSGWTEFFGKSQFFD